MKRFLLGILVGLIFAFLAGVIFVLVLVKLTSSKQAPTIAGNSVLVLNLDGDLPEAAPVEVPLPFFEQQSPVTVRDFWASLRYAATDKRIKAVVIRPQGLTAGWAKLQEIRDDLTAFKKSGKPVYAQLQSAGMREYYVASVADQIYDSPDDLVNVKGMRLEAMYLKGALDKVGVAFEFDHVGRYKDAGDMFTRKDMSPETREVLNQVLDQLYGDFCSTVATGRHKSADDIRAAVDQGPFVASKAKDAGLVDVLAYEDQLFGDVEKKVGAGNLTKLSLRTYSRAIPYKGEHFAFLAADGDIIRGRVDTMFGGDQVIASENITKTIRQLANDGTVKGVILRVDSPGGDAVASDEILHELKQLSNRKPVVISMSDYAASGGYFIAMTGGEVVAYPNTITGSIGVIYGKANIKELFNKLGIGVDALERGKYAGIDSAFTTLSDAEKQKLHEGIEATYHSFVSKVAAARKKSYDQIDPLAQGRVWMGAQAKGNGLVDDLGGIDSAVAILKQRAKISGDVSLYAYPPRRTLLEIFTSNPADQFAEASAQEKLRKTLGFLPSPSLLRGGILQLMPYQITVK